MVDCSAVVDVLPMVCGERKGKGVKVKGDPVVALCWTNMRDFFKNLNMCGCLYECHVDT